MFHGSKFSLSFTLSLSLYIYVHVEHYLISSHEAQVKFLNSHEFKFDPPIIRLNPVNWCTNKWGTHNNNFMNLMKWPMGFMCLLWGGSTYLNSIPTRLYTSVEPPPIVKPVHIGGFRVNPQCMYVYAYVCLYGLCIVICSMFMSSCKRLRIMKGSEARGLGCGVW